MSCASGSRSDVLSALGVPPPVLEFMAEVEPEGSGESMFALGVETGVKREACELNAWGIIAGKDGTRESAGEGSAISKVRVVVPLKGDLEG